MSSISDSKFELLLQDHKKVKAVIARLLEIDLSNNQERMKLLKELKLSLQLHEKIEEDVVYPELENIRQTHDLALESYQEHHIVDILLDELENADCSNDNWRAKLITLQENLEHHIQDEEKTLFPTAIKVLDSDRLNKIEQGIRQMHTDNHK